jgi:cathepsin L
MFTSFVKNHAKSYASDEFFPRYAIFKANVNAIRKHNAGSHSYTMAVNEFADMTFAEFTAKMTGLQVRDNAVLRAANENGPHLQVTDMEGSLDWRTKGAVNPIKNQQQCGSCWAFSALGAVEGSTQIKTGKLINLSEQQLVDCSTPQGNHGCNGGLMDSAFQYIISNKGVTTTAAYPYVAKDNQCKTGQTAAATISSFKNVAANSETSLMAAINLGPVSVAIQASSQAFQFYSGGVLDDASCGKRLDHGVTLVGYGTENNVDFWIVRNSWGGSWGESGYIRMVRGKNQCGIAAMASYVVV